MLPIFAYITYRVGKVRREVSGLTQRSLAEVSAITEESLSVSGILLSKTFGQQRASIERFAKESRRLGDLQIRQQMIGRWFFAMIGTFFSIAPAFVYLLAGTLIISGDTERQRRHHRGLHHPPEPPLLPARAAAQRPGRDPGRAGAVRPHLRVPGDGRTRSATRRMR